MATQIARIPVQFEDTTSGLSSSAHRKPPRPLPLLLTHLGGRESEGRALAAEVLHLYREVHLIEQLSEQLVALLNSTAVAESALAQAQRLITATHGSILVIEEAGRPLSSPPPLSAAPPGNALIHWGPARALPLRSSSAGLGKSSTTALPIRALSIPSCLLQALICAPLARRTAYRRHHRAGQQLPRRDLTRQADLKLLNTIALQTAAAIENSLLCAEMVDDCPRTRRLAAELQAASTVQQLLLQSASRPRPAFRSTPSIFPPAKSAAISSSSPPRPTDRSPPLSATSPERA